MKNPLLMLYIPKDKYKRWLDPEHYQLIETKIVRYNLKKYLIEKEKILINRIKITSLITLLTSIIIPLSNIALFVLFGLFITTLIMYFNYKKFKNNKNLKIEKLINQFFYKQEFFF